LQFENVKLIFIGIHDNQKVGAVGFLCRKELVMDTPVLIDRLRKGKLQSAGFKACKMAKTSGDTKILYASRCDWVPYLKP
jgi:hypothetical protein